METSDPDEHKESTMASLVIITGIALAFFLWGLLLFFAIGDKGPPTWDFGAVEDIPGQSPFSTHSPKAFPSLFPQPAQNNLLEEQHVGRSERRTTESQERGNK